MDCRQNELFCGTLSSANSSALLHELQRARFCLCYKVIL